MEQAPQAETLDRKELLEQQFEQSAEAQPRDEVGRYAEKQAEQQAVDPADEPVWRKPPASWKKEYHEYWSKADPKIQEYAWQREEQMKRGVEPLLSKAQFADAMNQALEPYLPTIQGLGMKPEQAVAALAQADYTLRNSPPTTEDGIPDAVGCVLRHQP